MLFVLLLQIVFCCICLVLLAFVTICGVLSVIVHARRKKRFFQEHPEYTKVRLIGKNGAYLVKFDIFSVNDEFAFMSAKTPNSLLVPLGEVKICTDVVFADHADGLSRNRSFFGNLNELYYEFIHKNPKNKNQTAYTITFVAEKGVEYELKADPYEQCINLVCIRSEKGEIISFKK